MIPPEALVQGQSGRCTDAPPAVFPCEVLKKRRDFLKAAQSLRQGTPGFLLQARRRAGNEAPEGLIRIGFTCSRKVGNAVIRNRARRRLREIARLCLGAKGRPGWDYVLVGRPETTIARAFPSLLGDLCRALDRIHQSQP